MKLDGSCACGAISFSLMSKHPYPFNVCYCSICRKTAGAGGFAINLGGEADSLVITGQQNTAIYQARLADPAGGESRLSPCERHFCPLCSSNVWVWDPRWPELIHPFASAIDTELPQAPERTHLMLASRMKWVELRVSPQDKRFDEYPEESIAEWHQRLGLES